jgi:hypothetical protein
MKALLIGLGLALVTSVVFAEPMNLRCKRVNSPPEEESHIIATVDLNAQTISLAYHYSAGVNIVTYRVVMIDSIMIMGTSFHQGRQRRVSVYRVSRQLIDEVDEPSGTVAASRDCELLKPDPSLQRP